MSLFNRKREDRRINRDNEVPIPVYGPHDTFSAADYKLAYLLAEFEHNFEHTCKSWLANAKPDMYNRSYMDLMIDQLMTESLKSLDAQEVDHQSSIYELAKVWSADLIKARFKLDETKAMKAEVNQELVKLERIYHKGTSYEDDANIEDEEVVYE